VQTLLSLAFHLAGQIGSAILMQSLGAWSFNRRLMLSAPEPTLEQELFFSSEGHYYVVSDEEPRPSIDIGESWYWV
jgi:hypothetical protein